MRIGILGGTFDPPHRGHLHLAGTAQREIGLDRILFVPCARQPLKDSKPFASAWDRFAMVALMIRNRPSWRLSTLELERGGASYTVETLRELRRLLPGNRWFLLMGGDSLASLPLWRDYSDILRLATPVVLARRADRPQAPPPEIGDGEVVFLRSRILAVSSTEIRRGLAAGTGIHTQIPASVRRYVETQGLYQRNA